jgi:hypothetical protein
MTIRRSQICLILSLSATLTTLAPRLSAQEVRLEGFVNSSSHDGIPGVTVTTTNEGTYISHTTVSNSTGHFVFLNLSPGKYTLVCELQGFTRLIHKGIVLQVAGIVTIDIELQVGELNAEVVVNAAAPMLDLATNRVGDIVQERQLADLPLNGRNPMMLFYLQAGTNPYDAIGSSQQAVGSVDGLRTNANNVKVEGVWASDPSVDMSPAAPNVSLPLEAVGSYRVTTSSAGADEGRGSGAQVSVAYKSGTNRFHAGVYDFNRNTIFNANNFFSNRQQQDRPKFLSNQYGATFGGPIIKNRTFLFVSWEGLREIQGTVSNRYSYTSTMRTGIFRYYKGGKNSGSLVDKNGNPLISTGKIGTINLLNSDSTRKGMDSSGKVSATLAKMPLPNNYDLGDGFNLGGYRYVSNDPTNSSQFVAKVDHTISPKHQLTLALGGYGSDDLSDKMYSGYYNYEYQEKKRNIMAALVSALQPNLMNELNLGATRRLTFQTPLDPANSSQTGLFQMYGVINPGGRGAAPEGNLAGVYESQRDPVDAYIASDILAWVKRNHTIKAGFEVAHTTKNNWYGGDEYIPAIYTDNSSNPANFTASAINSVDLARAKQFANDFTGMIGHVNQTYNANSLEIGYVPYDTRYRQLRQREYGAFLTDTWKVAQNLTFNYGARWDLLPPAWMANGVFSYPKGGSAAVLGISGPIGTYQTALAPNGGKDIVNWDWNNLGPNVGLTWDPSKTGRMSVSANYRISYDRSMQSVYNRLEDQNVGMNTTATVYPNVTIANLKKTSYWSTYQGESALLLPAGAVFSAIPDTRQNRAYAIDENISTPYTQNWSFRIQREVGKDWYLQVAYVGNHSVGGWRAKNYNQVEIRSNGFLSAFKAAQRNLAANGDPNKGESIGVLAQIFSVAPGGKIPNTLNTYIQTGQAAYLANYIDQTALLTTKAGLADNFFRMNPQVADASIIGNLSQSTWNGLKLDVSRRFSQGIYAQFNYTLGKGLTDYAGGQTLYEDFRDNANPKLDKSLQQFDSKHVIQGNVIWELPFGANKRWLNRMDRRIRTIVSGWQLNGIAQFATSRPFTISSGYQNLSANRYSTANYKGTDFDITNQVIKTGTNIMALTSKQIALFSNPDAGSPGGTPYYAFRGPDMVNLDASLLRNFKLKVLGEQGIMQFRAEAFNVLNRTNFNVPSGTDINSTSTSFGAITSAYSPRILQFALKLNF